MVSAVDDQKATCRVIDQHPDTKQKKISFLVSPATTVTSFIQQVATQYSGYSQFELTLESQNINLKEHSSATLSNIGVAINKCNIFTLAPSSSSKATKSSAAATTAAATAETVKKLSTTEQSEAKVENWNVVPRKNKRENPPQTNIVVAAPIVNGSSTKMIADDVDVVATSDKQQAIAIETEISSDDDLALGASASPTEDTSSSPPALPALFDSESNDHHNAGTSSTSTFRRIADYQSKSNFVGLVNQAMTCYLNSLLQALFMTPEFRNALYNWEFDGKNETKSIPYQLQKLFVNLQTSTKNAVETTDLTKSFGWDSTEAWQQHDIQELTRVLFDALEQKFKNTKQADLINNLYEGKMIDYVKCLECETEKSREDTFLDIPLPVRPFGSTNAYESIEEAMKGFVTPETLDGNNQYFCEKCDKKCDAHKGLKFKKFPYILTLHLKRFDFDYQTLNRIKLNDKVTFPAKFNLNGFVTEPNSLSVKPNDITSIGSVESAVKSDDCSTTDSVLDEDGSQCANNNQNHYPESTQDYPDEGIDMSVNGDCKSLMSNSTSIDSSGHAGPFVYDLFAIMIHSGSASGGHYYAYIRDFESGMWFSFNDTTVSPITQEDIMKSFGGNSTYKNYYSSFSSSTNAYMLMYRQHDPARNCPAIKDETFPPHIKELVERLKTQGDSTKHSADSSDSKVLKLKVYFKNPVTKEKIDNKLFITSDSPLKEIVEEAHSKLKVNSVAPLARSRLVAYDSASDSIEKSFENMDDVPIGEIMDKLINRNELLLEVRSELEEFEVYETHGVNTKVFEVRGNDIDGPIDVRAYEHKTFGDLKKAIAKKLKLNTTTMLLAIHKNSKDKPKILDDDAAVKDEGIYGEMRIYMSLELDETKFRTAVAKFNSVIVLYFALPASRKETLEKLSIPSYEGPAAACGGGDGADVVDGIAFNVTATPDIDLFFKAVLECDTTSSSAEDDATDSCENQKLLKVLADRRMNVNKLKTHLQSYVKIPMEYFKIFHVQTSQSENECTELTHTLNSAFKEEERLVIELGRALLPGESKVKLHYLNINDEETTDLEKLPFICDYIIRESAEVGQMKREIIAHMRQLDEKYANMTYERTRLRKKTWKGPGTMYIDDQKFGDDYIIKVSLSQDIIVQELATDAESTHDVDGEPINDDSKSLFIRQFYPSKLEYGRWHEIIINKNTELKAIMSKLSSVPEENVMYMKLTRSCSNTSVTQLDNMPGWHDDELTMESDHTLNSIPDGSIYLFKDKTEPVKKLTTEERMEISKKENPVSTTSTYSPRRERGLKIYLDSSPKKRDDY